jgi:predicted peptidase
MINMENAAEIVAKFGAERKTYVSPDGGHLEYCRKLVGKPAANGKYPVLLFLHGAGQRGDGTNNGVQLYHAAADILTYAQEHLDSLLFLAPQCPAESMWIEASWSLKEHTMTKEPTPVLAMAMAMLRREIEETGGDPQRLYISGLSMGGFGSWDVLSRYPDMFAAALICCGGGDLQQAPRLVNIPIYVFHGAKDPTVMPSRSRDMVQAIRQAGGKLVSYTEYPDEAHASWIPAYNDQANLQALFSHRKI